MFLDRVNEKSKCRKNRGTERLEGEHLKDDSKGSLCLVSSKIRVFDWLFCIQ